MYVYNVSVPQKQYIGNTWVKVVDTEYTDKIHKCYFLLFFIRGE